MRINQNRSLAGISVALVLLAIVIYFQTIGFGYISIDDDRYVTDNPRIKSFTTANLTWAFTSSYFANWHPLTWLSHMAAYYLFGLRAGGHHFVNVVLHAANGVLLFLALCALTRARAKDDDSLTIWACGFVAALFVVHPLHVESVAWISERKDVLSTFFGFLALWAYAKYAEAGRIHWYICIAVSLVLSLLAKPMLVTLPFVFLLLDYWPLARFKSVSLARILVEKLPLIAIVAASSVVTFIVQNSGGSVIALQKLPLQARLGNALVAYALYLAKVFWPFGLGVFYPHAGANLPGWQISFSLLLLALVTAFALALLKKCPYVAVGWFWFLGTLVPVIGIVQVGEQAMADRYAYVPAIGPFIAVTWLFAGLASKGRILRKALAVVGLAVVVVLTGAAWIQTHYWQDSVHLLEHTIRVTGPNSFAENALGKALVGGRNYQEAAAHFKRALEIDPKNAEAHNNLATQLAKLGHFDEARKHFEAAVAADPGYTEPLANLGKALSDLGRHDEAVAAFTRALEIDPDDPHAHEGLGTELSRQRKFTEAQAQFAAALRIDADNPSVLTNLGKALTDSGHPQEAMVQYAHALTVQENYVPALVNFGVVLAKTGHVQEAIGSFETALTLDPEQKEATAGLAGAYAAAGDSKKAITGYEHALQLNPRSAALHNDLGYELARTEQFDKAIEQYNAALAIDPKYVPALNNLGHALWGKGLPNEAIAKWREAAATDPKDESGYFNLGTAAFMQKRYDDAVAFYSKAEAINPKNLNLISNLGLVFQEQGKMAEAETRFRRCLELAPNAAPVMASLAHVLAEQGKRGEALKVLDKAIAADPKNQTVRDQRAALLQK